MKKIQLRPHHLICIQTFIGDGYSDQFCQNFENILSYLKQYPTSMIIEVTRHEDNICLACPKNRHTTCLDQLKIADLDARYLKALEIHEGDLFSYESLLKQIQEKLSLSQFREICKTCQWYQQGYCDNIVQALLKD